MTVAPYRYLVEGDVNIDIRNGLVRHASGFPTNLCNEFTLEFRRKVTTHHEVGLVISKNFARDHAVAWKKEDESLVVGFAKSASGKRFFTQSHEIIHMLSSSYLFRWDEYIIVCEISNFYMIFNNNIIISYNWARTINRDIYRSLQFMNNTVLKNLIIFVTRIWIVIFVVFLRTKYEFIK